MEQNNQNKIVTLTFFKISDKAGSVAHLVENEIPLSTSTAATKKIRNSSSILGNFTDNHQNTMQHEPSKLLFDEILLDTIPQNPNIIKKQENLYINVLPTPVGQSRIQPVPGPLKPLRPIELQTWNETHTPTVHTYSNIEEKMNESIEFFLTSMPYRKQNSQDYNENKEISFDDDELENVDENENQDDQMTVSDENDEINHNQGVIIHDTADGKSLSTSSCSAATAATQIKLAPTRKKAHLEIDVLKHGNGVDITNSIGSNNSIGNTSVSSSIGDHSQTCLVKSPNI